MSWEIATYFEIADKNCIRIWIQQHDKMYKTSSISKQGDTIDFCGTSSSLENSLPKQDMAIPQKHLEEHAFDVRFKMETLEFVYKTKGTDMAPPSHWNVS